MTITYTAEVATCERFGCFIKLLARWRGSIYKLVWMDLLFFLALYYSINMIYFYMLSEDSKRTFESIVYYCSSYSSLIPLSFVLGFYVNLVMARWWEQYTTIPWPDSIAVFVSAHVHGQDEGGRVMRRTVMRYVCLCLTIVFTMISPCVKKRFPKLKHLVDAGLLLENEKKIIEEMDYAFPKYPKHWMPIVWAASIITRARNEGRIRDDFAHKTIIDELNHFRGQSGTLMYYDFISIPLVYTQVVTIAVYSFFVCSLLAHQWTELKKDTYESFDFSMPIFITMEFFFYMGWLKVAETLINPFGEDDDDFEINWMIDRNLQVSYLIVDEMHHEHPELVKDQYWDEVYPTELPYEANTKREQHPEYSTAKYGLQDHSVAAINKIAPNVEVHANSLLSIRSERFKQAFHRFSQMSEDGSAAERQVEQNVSLTDVERVQCITSYRNASPSQESVRIKMEDVNAQIPPLKEEKEKEREFENLEEEEEKEEEDLDHTLMEEIEEEDMEEAFIEEESDSDSDPFEKLRHQRHQERIDRTNAFLSRYFGNSYKIASPPYKPDPSKVEKKKKFKDYECKGSSHNADLISIKSYVPLRTSISRTSTLKEENASKEKLKTDSIGVQTTKILTFDREASYRDHKTATETISVQTSTILEIADAKKMLSETIGVQTSKASALRSDATPRAYVSESDTIGMQSLSDVVSGSRMISTSSQTPMTTYTDTTTPAKEMKDVALSPMSSLMSLSSFGSSDVSEWDVVDKASSATITGPQEKNK